MDFALTSEQQELKRQARSWLAERYPLDRDWDAAPDDAWADLADLGWLGVSVAEEEGGAGLGFLEEAVLLEELGRALYPGPYFSTVALALPQLSGEQQAEVAAGGKRWSAEVDGLVPDWGLVDAVLTDDGEAAPEGEALESIDPTRPLGRLANPRGGEASPRALAALAALEAGPLERDGEPARALGHVGIPVAVEALVGQPRRDHSVAEERLRAAQQRRQRELEVHHQAVHAASFVRMASATRERSCAGEPPKCSIHCARL